MKLKLFLKETDCEWCMLWHDPGKKKEDQKRTKKRAHTHNAQIEKAPIQQISWESKFYESLLAPSYYQFDLD